MLLTGPRVQRQWTAFSDRGAGGVCRPGSAAARIWRSLKHFRLPLVGLSGDGDNDAGEDGVLSPSLYSLSSSSSSSSSSLSSDSAAESERFDSFDDSGGDSERRSECRAMNCTLCTSSSSGARYRTRFSAGNSSRRRDDDAEVDRRHGELRRMLRMPRGRWYGRTSDGWRRGGGGGRGSGDAGACNWPW